MPENATRVFNVGIDEEGASLRVDVLHHDLEVAETATPGNAR